MQKTSLIALIAISTLLVSSCSQSPANNAADTQETEERTQAARPTSPESSENTPQVVPDSPTQYREVPGLKRATDPNQYVNEKGLLPGRNRQDPFGLFPVPGEIKEDARVAARQGNRSTSPAQPPSLPARSEPLPQQADLARAVRVSGVAQVGNAVVAIIKAPNELTSRYVRAGQYIADGRVLVKRIDIDRQPTPVVVLEELGMEVYQPVQESTEAADASESPEASAALLPPPPPSPSI